MKAKTRTQQSFFDEVIVDNFAGGGGASVGIELATGRPVDIAINHDPAAVLMHRANHPYTTHYREDVWSIDPRKVCHGQQVGLAWFSPDCKHFSKAKGGKPVDKKIRGLAWVSIRWALEVRPRVMMIENVEEIQTWGPVITKPNGDQYPDREHKGETFQGFIKILTTGISPSTPAFLEACEFLGIDTDSFEAKRLISGLGYNVEFSELRACDYGAPTIRKRFFLIARCDGKSIVWPEPTHGDPSSEAVKSGKLKPWRTAAEIIDWSLPCPSIFSNSKEIKQKYGVHAVRPLAENTMKRVARGIDKFVLKSTDPFILNYKFQNEPEPVGKPMSTITAVNAHLLAAPVLAVNTMNNTGTAPNEPLKTVTTGGHHMLVTPYMTAIGQTGFSEDRSYGVDQPIRTVVSKAEQCMIAPSLIQYHSETQDGEVRGQSISEQLRTVDSSNRYAIASATLIQTGYGEAPGQQPRVPGLEKPLGTIVSTGKHAVVTSQMVQLNNHCENRTEAEPLNTIPAQGMHFAESRAMLMKYYGTGEGQRLSDPLGTVTARDRFGLVLLKIEKLQPGTPCGHWSEIRKMLNAYCGYKIGEDEILVYVIDGVEYILVDIGLRMLTPRELFAAQGFPPDYIIDVDCEGNAYPRSEQVARCGNAVPPPFAVALVRANLPELCVRHCHSMAELRETMAI